MSILFNNPLLGASGQGPSADLGDTIEQSLRFPAGSNAVLNSNSQFQATGGAFTLSFWVKFGAQKLNTSNTLSFLGKMIQFQGNCQLIFGYDRRNGGAIFDNNGGTNNSPVFRDPSAWYHFLVTDDGTGNSENTYTVNGSVTWTPGASSRTASNQTFSIGYASGWGEFDGYFADVQFIDGSVQAATEFGRYNEDGVWVPKNYTGTYGTNGFHLDFADSSDLGNDVSGNNNDFTATNFDTGDIAVYIPDVVSSTGSFYSGQGPELMFDGSSSTYTQSSTQGGTVTWTPSQTITYSSSVVVRSQRNAGDQCVFNGSTTVSMAAGGVPGETTIATGSGTISSMAFSGYYGGSVQYIKVDGTILVDNTDNDVDYFDTPTSNYPTFNPLYPVNSNGPQRFNDANLGIDLSSGSSLGYNRFFFSTLKMPSSGKWYFEHTRPSTVDSAEPFLQYPFVGFTTLQDTSAAESSNTWYNNISMAGGSGYGFRYGTTSNAAYGPTQGSQTWPIGAVIGCSYDADTGNVRFYNQGVDMGLFDTLPSNTDFYLSAIQNYTHGPAKFNFGQMPFVYTPPTGFKALHLNELDEPTIKDGSDHFQAITGAGSTILSVAQAAFSNGLWWVKDRQNSNNHQLVSSEYSGVIGCPTVGSYQSNFPAYAAPSGNSVAWCWGTDATGLNKEAGFEIIQQLGTLTYTTVNHRLEKEPKMIIAFAGRGDLALTMYHASLGPNYRATMSSALQFYNEPAWWGGDPTDFTATTFGVGPTAYTNDNENFNGGMTYFVWTDIPGYSAFGDYVGNSISDGPYIYTGFRPSMILYKCATTTGNWHFRDTTRSVYNPAEAALYANLQYVESTPGNSGNYVDILSNGFKIRNGDGDQNTSGQTYIWAAWAENPFGGEKQPPATAR